MINNDNRFTTLLYGELRADLSAKACLISTILVTEDIIIPSNYCRVLNTCNVEILRHEERGKTHPAPPYVMSNHTIPFAFVTQYIKFHSLRPAWHG